MFRSERLSLDIRKLMSPKAKNIEQDVYMMFPTE